MKKTKDKYGDLVVKIEYLDNQIVKMRAQLNELRGLLVDTLKPAPNKKIDRALPAEMAFLEIEDSTGGAA